MLIIIIITDQDSDHDIGIGDKQIEQNQATFLNDNNISGTESDSSVGSSSYFKVLGKIKTEKPKTFSQEELRNINKLL